MDLPPRLLTKKPFMIVRVMEKLSFCGPVDLVPKELVSSFF